VGCAVVILLGGMALAGPLRSPVGPWGQIADVTSPPEQAWSLETTEDVRSASMVGGVVVTTGEQTVRGLDPASGEELWLVSGFGGQCTSDTSTLLCTDGDGGAVRIDPATGTSTDLGITDALAVAESDGDLFAITRDEQRPFTGGHLQRISEGEVVWSTPVVLGQDSSAYREPMAVIAGHVLTPLVTDSAELGGAGAVFDGQTGEQLSAEPIHVVQLGPGVWASLEVDASTLYVRGEEEPLPDGAGQRLQYDDEWHSDDLIVTSDEGVLSVQDRQTGERRWVSERPAFPIARIDGVLLHLVSTGDSATLQGLRISSGEVLWQKEDTWMMCPCVGDRSTLAGQIRELAPGGGFAGEGPVVGVDVESGEQLWQVEAPSPMMQIVTDGEHLVLVAPGQLAGFRLG